MPEVRAALAVRTLASVAIRMPKKPARVEKTAPTRKQTAVIQFPIPTPITTKRTAAKITSTLYSEKRNALAPSRIAPAISFMRSVPSSSFRTLPARYSANTSARTAQTGMIINISIFSFPLLFIDWKGKPGRLSNLLYSEPCRHVRERSAFPHCRGIRRMCQGCHTTIREQALDVRLTTRQRMAHCSAQKGEGFP